MKLGEWLSLARARLTAAGVEAAALEAQVLAAHALGVERTWVLAHPETPVEGRGLEVLLSRRLAREPLAYILGWREFYGRPFSVRPGVLIPRQETELLVELALELMPDGARVLDIGVGSGAIAITIALERPDGTVVATDISDAALEIARGNAHALHANVSIVKGDLFPPLAELPFDLIVSNPPYVAEGDAIGADVRHEPAEALFAGQDGLDVYRRLAVEGRKHLATGGALLLEVGAGQARQVREVFEAAGWTHKETRSDLGGQERVVWFQP